MQSSLEHLKAENATRAREREREQDDLDPALDSHLPAEPRWTATCRQACDMRSIDLWICNGGSSGPIVPLVLQVVSIVGPQVASQSVGARSNCLRALEGGERRHIGRP